MTFDINYLYNSLLGRDGEQSGKDYWTKQYNQAIANNQTHDQAVANIKNAFAQHSEYDTDHARHTRAAFASTGRDHGTYPTFSDMYIQNDDGSVSANPNWTGELNWYKDYVANLGGDDDDTGGTGGTGGVNTNTYDDSVLRGLINDLTGDLSSLRTAFDDYRASSADDMQNMWNNANWGWGPTVGGVRTQNELPGWAPKRGGTSGFFGRGGRAGRGLTTGSLNI